MKDHAQAEDDTKIFGFWVYLMTDLVIFAALFAVYLVLHDSTFNGPSSQELFHLPLAFAQTAILLTSSFTCSLGTLALHRKQKNPLMFWFSMTFLLGCAFLFLEIREFRQFIHEGASWRTSGFLSSFFSLVGTHGFHIAIGLIWMLVAILGVWTRGLIAFDYSRIFRMALFWHFLDIVWIFIFSIVYVMGNLGHA